MTKLNTLIPKDFDLYPDYRYPVVKITLALMKQWFSKVPADDDDEKEVKEQAEKEEVKEELEEKDVKEEEEEVKEEEDEVQELDKNEADDEEEELSSSKKRNRDGEDEDGQGHMCTSCKMKMTKIMLVKCIVSKMKQVPPSAVHL